MQQYDRALLAQEEIVVRIRRETGRVEVSADILHQAAGKLDDELDQVRLDYIGGKARMDALTQAMKQWQDRVAKAAAEDPAVIELQKVVNIRQKDLDRTIGLVKSNIASQESVDEKAAALAQAKAQVALQQEHAASAAGSDTLDALQKELTDLTADQAERAARMAQLQAELEKLPKGLYDLHDLQTTEVEAQAIRADLERAEESLHDHYADQGREEP